MSKHRLYSNSSGRPRHRSLCTAFWLVSLSLAPRTAAAWGQLPLAVTTTAATRSRSYAGGATTTTSTVRVAMTAMGRKTTKPANNSNNSEELFQSHSILDDGHGKVNGDLAATLWDWEQQHREIANLPKLSFSTRRGLRLVDEIVQSMEESPRGQQLLKKNDNAIRTDLVQEGVIALMDAFNDYRQIQQQQQQQQRRRQSATPDQEEPELKPGKAETVKHMEDQNRQFEAYARPILTERLWSTLDQTTRPVQLPESESNLWKDVPQVRRQLQKELGGRPPTTKELAARLEVPVETLELLVASKRGTLSMESTVEIKTPDSLQDQTTPLFTDQDEWEKQEGHLLDTGDKIIKEELVDEYQDEMYQYEGDDEMWIHNNQIQGPLREIIPDSGPTPDDVALSDMIRHDVGEFLTKTLTEDEVRVVRMSFGLDAGDPLRWKEIAEAMEVETSEAKELLRGALHKLQATYRSNYVESFLEDGAQDFSGEDTV